eukprot:jgi/Chrzof1/2971/Cz12g06150.t1
MEDDVHRRVDALLRRVQALPDNMLTIKEKGSALTRLILLNVADQSHFIALDDPTDLVAALKDLLTGPARLDGKHFAVTQARKQSPPPCPQRNQLTEPLLLRHRRPYTITDP